MTQCDKILDHIRKNGSITQREAFIDYGIQSFHRRLSDLRQAGYRLIGRRRKHPTTGQEYTRYYLLEAAR
ncbi:MULTISPECIES: helix-turn-helix domain-containing protein [unclassified Aminobacter]|uniref:helix-turn-helix domain-containing protein n=1 Tax=unclassified Aminobacter TaxID=2644704 RepID=UPI0004675E30|nr:MULTISPECIES: helix-turn-helix domain-containing protein [unclassified Aminobacter]TWH35573.1 helix-turn-helix protein [Aminobacter sp. J15]